MARWSDGVSSRMALSVGKCLQCLKILDKGSYQTRVLPCFHTLCVRCMEKTYDTIIPGSTTTVRCLICNAPVDLPPAGLMGLPSNKCEKHLHATIDYYCLDCMSTMCTVCFVKERKHHVGHRCYSFDKPFASLQNEICGKAEDRIGGNGNSAHIADTTQHAVKKTQEHDGRAANGKFSSGNVQFGTCIHCLNYYSARALKAIPCLHMSCLRCLEQFPPTIIITRPKNVIASTCRKCCKDFSVPPSGYAGLPSSFCQEHSTRLVSFCCQQCLMTQCDDCRRDQGLHKCRSSADNVVGQPQGIGRKPNILTPPHDYSTNLDEALRLPEANTEERHTDTPYPITHKIVASQELLRQIGDITECPICAESFRDPKVLPCIHTFCLCCLEKYGEKNNPGDQMNCPICRKDFSIPSGGFKELPNNYFIIQMLGLNRSSAKKAAQQCVECEVCLRMSQKSAANAYCIECSEYLCEPCSGIHKAQKMSRMHQVVNIDDKPTGQELMKMALQYCEQHPTDELKFYCYDCKMVACVVCYVTNKHNKHECCELKKSAEEFRVLIKKDTDNVMASVSNCQQELKKLESEMDKFNKSADAICSEIAERCKKLRSLLDQRQISLMDKLTSFRKTHLKKFVTRKDGLERQSVIMESFKRYCDELKEKGTSADVSRAAVDLHMRAEELVKIEEELTSSKLSSVEMKFMPSVENVKNWIGDLSFTPVMSK